MPLQDSHKNTFLESCSWKKDNALHCPIYLNPLLITHSKCTDTLFEQNVYKRRIFGGVCLMDKTSYRKPTLNYSYILY